MLGLLSIFAKAGKKPSPRASDGRFGTQRTAPPPKAKGSTGKQKAKAKGGGAKQPASGKTKQETANTNRASIAAQTGMGAELDGTMARLNAGMASDLDKKGHDALIDRGLAQRDAAGHVSLSPEGKRYYAQAAKGNLDGARAALDAGKAKAERNTARADQQAKTKAERQGRTQARQAERDKAKGEREAKAKEKADAKAKAAEEQPKGVGGGGGKESGDVAPVLAASGIPSGDVAALQAFGAGNEVSPEALERLGTTTGLVQRGAGPDGPTYRLSPAGKAFIAAAKKGDVAGAKDALAAGKESIVQGQAKAKATTDRASQQAARQAERDKAQADRERRAFESANRANARANARAQTHKAIDSHVPLFFAALTKVDAEQRIVEGIASTETVDAQGGIWEGQRYDGDVVDAGAIEEALADYLNWANVREMHQNSAVGTALKAEVVDGTLNLAVQVVDDSAWTKVKTGVYKGFSIGGKVLKAVIERLQDGRTVRRILKLLLTEISLVDRPANPDARILVWKAEGVTTMEDEQQLIAAMKKGYEQIIQSSAGELLIAKAADPSKIVAQIQQLRNDAEMDGDGDAAQLYTQAISLVLQASGDMDSSDADAAAAADDAGDASAAGGADTALAMVHSPRGLAKVGRPVSGARMSAMQQVVKSLLDLLANAGDAQAGAALKAYGGMAAPDAAADADPAMDPMKVAAQMGEALGRVLQPALAKIDERLTKIEAQPAPGGPVLRVADKRIAGQQPLSEPAKTLLVPSGLVKAALDNLRQLANSDPNPAMRADYLKQYQELARPYNL